jgi:hypothetical protein
MANEEHLRILKQGVEAWNDWREYSPDDRPDLAGADLAGASLIAADLAGANLIGARLSEANLTSANLSGANLNGAVLHRADVYSADFFGADLSSADLSEANLSHANLVGADLIGADLSGADLNHCRAGSTVFADVDLGHAKGLDTVQHHGPSSIGIDTLHRSAGNIPDIFLRGAGVPEPLVEYTHSLVGQMLQFYSCFISYSHHDQRFCERLRGDLQARGVRVWFFPEDALMGRTVWGQIDRGIRIYDKLVVVCSEHSLQSGPVLREIERALQREDREGTDVLFPIRIDDYVFSDRWQDTRKPDVIAKVVGDFSGWDQDAAKYEASFRKLMKALQPETDAGAGKKAL